MTTLKKSLLAYARSLGFERLGVTRAVALQKEALSLEHWLAQGYAGEMLYMTQQPERRSDPEKLLPGAKTVIALAMPYYGAETASDSESAPALLLPRAEAAVSRYARERDYHKVMEKRLHAFLRYVESLAPDALCRTFVDAGPLLERPFAQRAGLGFIGKNTLLITKGLGSWVFLAHIVTTLELEPDAPDLRSCGACTLCIEACPTQAIRAPFELDARRCISYLTIELEGEIPEALRPKMGEWVFGCDVCQDVCPHNTRIPPTQVSEFKEAPASLTLAELLNLDEEKFSRDFAGTAFTRTGRHSLVRNACVTAANLGRFDLIPTLERLHHEDPDVHVRAHAGWAVRQLTSRGSFSEFEANV